MADVAEGSRLLFDPHHYNIRLIEGVKAERHAMTLRVGTCIALVSVLLAGCHDHKTADERLRAILKIAPGAPLNEPNIRAAILSELPVGTPESDVEPRLKGIGVNDSTLSHYYDAHDGEPGVLRIEYDPDVGGFVKNSYGIFLEFDADKKLSGVKVESWLTGL